MSEVIQLLCKYNPIFAYFADRCKTKTVSDDQVRSVTEEPNVEANGNSGRSVTGEHNVEANGNSGRSVTGEPNVEANVNTTDDSVVVLTGSNEEPSSEMKNNTFFAIVTILVVICSVVLCLLLICRHKKKNKNSENQSIVEKAQSEKTAKVGKNDGTGGDRKVLSESKSKIKQQSQQSSGVCGEKEGSKKFAKGPISARGGDKSSTSSGDSVCKGDDSKPSSKSKSQIKQQSKQSSGEGVVSSEKSSKSLTSTPVTASLRRKRHEKLESKLK